MALPSATLSFPSISQSSFHTHLQNSKTILALLGAGLSASSGLATFHGVGSDGLWQNHDPAELATPEAFARDPELVWRFYQERARQALDAEPNAAHVALAQLARVMGPQRFTAVSMNIDGLCKRAGHPRSQLLEVHGSLFDIKCSAKDCDYVEKDNFDPDFVTTDQNGSLSIPRCPKCISFLRPAIVWFGEGLPKDVVAAADAFIDESQQIDVVLVIGTTAQVWPAAGYVDSAIEKGARVAMINIDRGDLVPGSGELGLTSRDWFFVGDAGKFVPEMLAPVLEGGEVR